MSIDANNLPRFRQTICETSTLIIEHEYEMTQLRHKEIGKILLEDDFYGNPKVGLIDKHSQWAVVAGEHLTVWTPKTSKRFNSELIQWVHAIRLKGPNTIELLTDPWSENSAIWTLTLNTLSVQKVRNFADYFEKPDTEDLVW